ncbi:MAG: histidinol-phosphatase [Bacteroidales bacterium]|nr:histidinol-phosphatase [Bacteroidales bacterium]
MLGNLHTHTSFSDGSSPPENYIDEAIKQGFSFLGFTDHSPVPFPNTFAIHEGGLDDYVEAINRLKVQGSGESTKIENRKSKIEILLGLEYDYIPGLTGSVRELRDAYPFDYIIGSVHLIRNTHPGLIWFIDGPQAATYDQGLRDVFGGDARKAVTAYWRQLQEMVTQEKPDIIGHFDKVKMHNHDRFFREDDPWYVALAEESLELIRQTGAVVEINTRGLYKKRSASLFPSSNLLKKILQLKIPVALTSDAHKPEELSLHFDEARAILQEIGFRSQWMLAGAGWSEIPV